MQTYIILQNFNAKNDTVTYPTFLIFSVRYRNVVWCRLGLELCVLRIMKYSQTPFRTFSTLGSSIPQTL